MFVVKDIAAPGQRNMWCCMLSGGIICDLACCTHGKSGSAIGYKSAMATRRNVWLSQGFRTKHMELSQIIDAKMQMPDSKWTPLASHAEMLAAAARATRQKRPGNVLVFVSPSEQTSDEFARVKLKVTAADAAALFAIVDRTRSLGNVCGR